MDRRDFLIKVWSFYLRLEKDFINALNFVSFSEDNFSTYSIEFERLILSVCSEIDVVMKLLCARFSEGSAAENIGDYFRILSANTDILSVKVKFYDGKTYEPFSGWREDASPFWWTSYNKIKHDRIANDNYKRGNLQNAFYSLAGLYCLNRFFCKEIGTAALEKAPFPASEFFEVDGWEVIQPKGGMFFTKVDKNGKLGLYRG